MKTELKHETGATLTPAEAQQRKIILENVAQWRREQRKRKVGQERRDFVRHFNNVGEGMEVKP